MDIKEMLIENCNDIITKAVENQMSMMKNDLENNTRTLSEHIDKLITKNDDESLLEFYAIRLTSKKHLEHKFNKIPHADDNEHYQNYIKNKGI